MLRPKMLVGEQTKWTGNGLTENTGINTQEIMGKMEGGGDEHKDRRNTSGWQMQCINLGIMSLGVNIVGLISLPLNSKNLHKRHVPWGLSFCKIIPDWCLSMISCWKVFVFYRVKVITHQKESNLNRQYQSRINPDSKSTGIMHYDVVLTCHKHVWALYNVL
jgi:hypothetical protein